MTGDARAPRFRIVVPRDRERRLVACYRAFVAYALQLAEPVELVDTNYSDPDGDG